MKRHEQEERAAKKGEFMRHRKRTRLVLAIAMLAFGAMCALGVPLAQADVNSGLGGANEISVGLSSNGQETDIQGADVQVNLYRIATGSKNAKYDMYDYAFDVPSFKGLAGEYDPSSMTSDAWQRMAEESSEVVQKGNIPADVTARVGERVSGLADGIYLVLAPKASTRQYEYEFVSALVALPGKVSSDGTFAYNTATDGRWANTEPVLPVPVTLKWSRTPRHGSLRIDKTVNDFKGESTTFVYHIVDAETNGKVYENFAAVQYTTDGTQSTTVNHIPAGIELVVTEEYTGARYRLASENDQRATIVADDITPVAFTNEPNGSGKGGHGIENHFVFDAKKGDWQLEARTIDASEDITGS